MTHNAAADISFTKQSTQCNIPVQITYKSDAEVEIMTHAAAAGVCFTNQSTQCNIPVYITYKPIIITN